MRKSNRIKATIIAAAVCMASTSSAWAITDFGGTNTSTTTTSKTTSKFSSMDNRRDMRAKNQNTRHKTHEASQQKRQSTMTTKSKSTTNPMFQ